MNDSDRNRPADTPVEPHHHHRRDDRRAETAEGAEGRDPRLGPSDRLVLDIGGDIGALAVHTAAERELSDIEISPAGDRDRRTHNTVRARGTGDEIRYVAVFPSVPAGDYTVWRDAATPAGAVTVRGGEVTTFHLG